jgi:flagellar L-ring protein precursor FlgH
MKKIALLLLASTTMVACGPPHVAPFTPRQRAYHVGEYAQSEASARPSSGSLFSEANPGFLEDTRAVRVGDVLAIVIDESANAQGDTSTTLNKQSSGTMGANSIFGLVPVLKKVYPDLDPTKFLDYASTLGFTGTGNTTRKGTLAGNISVRVTRQMPNGDLFLEGTKVVLINSEEYHLYVSGLVRRSDIAQDNSVQSSRIADAQIEFTGRGDLADQTRKGWVSRIVDWLNPF